MRSGRIPTGEHGTLGLNHTGSHCMEYCMCVCVLGALRWRVFEVSMPLEPDSFLPMKGIVVTFEVGVVLHLKWMWSFSKWLWFCVNSNYYVLTLLSICTILHRFFPGGHLPGLQPEEENHSRTECVCWQASHRQMVRQLVSIAPQNG